MRNVPAIACALLLSASAALTRSAAAPQAGAAAADELTQLEHLAEESFVQDDLEAAVALYRQVADGLKATSEKTRIAMTIAYLEHLLGRDSDALGTVTEALVLDPEYPFQADLYNETFRGVFYDGRRRASQQRAYLAEEGVRQGTDDLRRGDYAAARTHFQTALTYVPNHPRALYNLAVADLNDHRPVEAEAGFQRLLALPGGTARSETRTLAMINLGYLYTQRQLYQEAEEVLEEAVALDPGNSSAWSNLGVSRRRLGEKTAAAEAFAKAYELAPEDSAVANKLALAFIDAHRWQEAVTLLEKATRAAPHSASIWLNLGLGHLGLGHGTRAAECFETAIRQDPADAGGWASSAAVHLARQSYEAEDHREALRHCDRALGWRPGLVNAWIYRGLAQEALGDLGDARGSFEKALHLDPTLAETHNKLGSVFYQLGLLDRAAEAFERALAIRPDFTGARENLAAVRDARGRPTATSPAATSSSRPPPAGYLTPRLGVRFVGIDYAALGLKGAMIESVEAGGPASRAGLRNNDLILKVDGRDVVDAAELKRYVRSRRIGSTVTLDLLRSNIPRRIDVRLD